MKKLFFCTGTNACGKSSLSKYWLNNSKFTYLEYPQFKTAVEVCPEFNLMIMGKYSTTGTSGGCDTIRKKEYTQTILKEIWDRDEDIYIEGYLIGSKVWIDELIEMNQGRRELVFVAPNTKLETCFARILNRSGKTQEQLKGNGFNVISRHKGLLKFKEWLRTERPQWKIVEADTENSTSEQVCKQLLTNS